MGMRPSSYGTEKSGEPTQVGPLERVTVDRAMFKITFTTMAMYRGWNSLNFTLGGLRSYKIP